jgi:hypothetical protein
VQTKLDEATAHVFDQGLLGIGGITRPDYEQGNRGDSDAWNRMVIVAGEFTELKFTDGLFCVSSNNEVLSWHPKGIEHWSLTTNWQSASSSSAH